MTKHISLIVSLISVLLAFILGYFYAYREYILQNSLDTAQIQYIDISTSSKNITIKNTPENIRFRVGGNIIHTGSVELK